MNTNNSRKAELLGMPIGTAAGRLRKILLFEMVRELGKDICFRCERAIASVDELSIEHEVAWMSAEDPVATYFDTSIISFSHLLCNSLAAIRPHKKYANMTEKSREQSRRRYADPARYERHLANKRRSYHNNRALAELA